jgi:hypothetical protein
MLDLLRKWVAPAALGRVLTSGGSRSAPPCRRTVQPGLERLEGREVPSATLSLVTDSMHNQVEYVLGADHSVWAHDNNGWHALGGYATALSGSVSASGQAEVYVIGADGGVYKNDGSWHVLGGRALGLSADLHDRVYAIGADHAVYENDGSWHSLGGYALDLSASEHLVNMGGTLMTMDEVYVIGADHAVYKNDGSWHDLGGYATAISATQDDKVYAIGADHAVYKNDGSWHDLGGSAMAISAGVEAEDIDGAEVNEDVVEVIADDHSVWTNTSAGWQSFGGYALGIAGNQFAGPSNDTSGTQNALFYAIGANNADYSHDDGGWHNHGGDCLS